MTSIPIVFLYRSKYYKANVIKVPGAAVEYHLFEVVPHLFFQAPLVFVSDPATDALIYDANELNHYIALAIIDSCLLLEEPLHL